MDNPHQLTKLEQFAGMAMKADMANPNGLYSTSAQELLGFMRGNLETEKSHPQEAKHVDKAISNRIKNEKQMLTEHYFKIAKKMIDKSKEYPKEDHQ